MTKPRISTPEQLAEAQRLELEHGDRAREEREETERRRLERLEAETATPPSEQAQP
jgi:hypothetical protein